MHLLLKNYKDITKISILDARLFLPIKICFRKARYCFDEDLAIIKLMPEDLKYP
jgi:hypothetical protein